MFSIWQEVSPCRVSHTVKCCRRCRQEKRSEKYRVHQYVLVCERRAGVLSLDVSARFHHQDGRLSLGLSFASWAPERGRESLK